MRCSTVKNSQLRVATVEAIDIQLEVGIHLNFDYSRLSTDHIRMNVYRSYTDGERTTARRQNKNQLKLTMHKRSLISNNTMKNNYTEPGLVTFHDIRPGNGAGLLLQPRSPHGAASPQRRAHV